MKKMKNITHSSKSMAHEDEKWNQWFAGVTDGDGCFYINKKEKNVSFELTTHMLDIRVLYILKNKLKAGSVKLRSGSNSARYRVKQKDAILNIVQRLNGKLYHPVRLKQFQQVCKLYYVEWIQPSVLLNPDNSYLSGLIDSDGSIVISINKSSSENSQISGVDGRIIRLIHAKGFSQLSLKITSSYESYVKMIQESYGYGSIYLEKENSKSRNPNPKYHWTIKSYEDIRRLHAYAKKNPLKSVKMHRLRLALLYFEYKNFKYHLKPSGTLEAKIWAKFAKAWYKYSY